MRGLIACAERGGLGEAYNLASGLETTILDLAKTINRLTGNATPQMFTHLGIGIGRVSVSEGRKNQLEILILKRMYF